MLNKVQPLKTPIIAGGILLFFGLLMRMLIWFFGGKEGLVFGTSETLYSMAIQEHFFNFVYYFHTKPIGVPIRDFISMNIFGNIQIGNFVFTSILDCFATILIYVLLIRLKTQNIFAFLLGIVWSLGLISWEYWRQSSHFDHLNVFLVSFFVWALYEQFKSPRFSRNMIASVAGGILVLFHSMALFLVPVFLVIIQKGTIFSIKYIKTCSLVLAIPSVIILLAAGKNLVQFGVPATSTVGGQNAMRFTSYELPKITSFVEQHNYPEWWLWCFNNGMEQWEDPVGRYVGAVSGQCFRDRNGKYDFALLKQKLIELGEDGLTSIVQQDQIVAQTTPWLLAGGVIESNTRFAIEYGKVSGSVWKDFLIEQPFGFIYRFARANYAHLSGVVFLGGSPYGAEYKGRSWIPRIAGFLVSPIFLFGILASYWIIIGSGWTLLMKRSLKFDLGISKIDKEDRQMLLIFSLLLCFFSVLTNMLTCCENNRMFMSFSPIALLIGGYVASLLVRLFMEKGSSKRG